MDAALERADQALSSVSLPQKSRQDIHADKINFASIPEAACAFFMEKWGRGWKCIPGVTFHVKVATKEVDFYVPDHSTFIEYHPITRWDWKSSKGSHLYGEHFRRLSSKEKRESWAAIHEEFAERYYQIRRLILDLTHHKHESLLCLTCPVDFYRLVLRGLFQAPIREHDFLKEWTSFVNST